jgi:hypothetical protein
MISRTQVFAKCNGNHKNARGRTDRRNAFVAFQFKPGLDALVYAAQYSELVPRDWRTM